MPTDLEERLGGLGRALPDPDDLAEQRMLAAVLATWKPARRRRAQASRLALAAALALLGGGSLAYAVKGTILHDSRRPAPTPTRVRQAIGRFAGTTITPPKGLTAYEQRLARNSAAAVAAAGAHAVVRIPTRWGGHASLYVSSTSQVVCDEVAWSTLIGGGCSPARGRHRAIELATTSPQRPHVLVTGHVWARRAARVVLRFRRGGETSIRLGRGWFLYEVPLAHQRTGADPVVAITALDARGRVVARLANPPAFARR